MLNKVITFAGIGNLAGIPLHHDTGKTLYEHVRFTFADNSGRALPSLVHFHPLLDTTIATDLLKSFERFEDQREAK